MLKLWQKRGAKTGTTMIISMSLVLDASAAVDLLARVPASATIQGLIGTQPVLAPALLVSECISSLDRWVRTHRMAAPDAEKCIQELSRMPLILVDDQGLAASAWAMRAFLQTTDALYVAAAREHGVPLLTTDRRLARAIRAQVADVAVIEI